MRNPRGERGYPGARLGFVLDLQPLRDFFAADPVLAYSLVAALFLLIVSLTAGLARLDLAALANPRAALICAVCVAAAVALRLLLYGGQPAVGQDAPMLAGLERFPLVLAALAYGPVPGVIVAMLYASFGAQGNVPAAREAVLALELSLVGWLAIYPSPREHRWAGPVNSLIAFGLAWISAGLAFSQWQGGDVTAANLLERNAAPWVGILGSAAILGLFGPGAYRRLFPHSRITLFESEEEGVLIAPLRRRREKRDRRLRETQLPGILEEERKGSPRRRVSKATPRTGE